MSDSSIIVYICQVQHYRQIAFHTIKAVSSVHVGMCMTVSSPDVTHT